jgi:hypothetical protein
MPAVIRRHLQLAIALLLPFMALRALLPAGFMPSADGGPRLVLCSEGLPASDSGGGPSQPAHGDAGDNCPFAHAAHFAPPRFHVTSVPFVGNSAFVARTSALVPASSKPLLSGGARAPPAFL